MIAELEHLWALAALDEELIALQAEMARFPGERRALEERLKSERVRLATLQSRLGEIQIKRREREREIDALSDQERKFQSQLPAIKKNEEYQALLHEITATRSKRSDLETDVLMQLEAEEKVKTERPAAEQALAAAERDGVERAARIAAEEQTLRQKVAGIEARRTAELEQLPPPVRNRYERIRGSREGKAVVPIAKGACGGCFRNQPPQTLQDARRRDRLILCEGCGRMLVYPPDAP